MGKQNLSLDGQSAAGKKVYTVASHHLGDSLALNPVLGCAETVNRIVMIALGKPIGGGASTADMYNCLHDTKRFTQVEKPLPGDIIISPTGKGSGAVPHGHVGIVAMHGILSNNSETGRLGEDYTLDTWTQHYGHFGGFPVEFYRFI